MKDVTATVFVYKGKEYMVGKVLGVPDEGNLVRLNYPLLSDNVLDKCTGLVSDVLFDYTKGFVVVYLSKLELEK